MIKAIDTAQDNPPPDSSGAEFVEPVGAAGAASPADTPFLTLEEKRRILAQIARVNPLDCFDETGDFDIVRAKRILPPSAIRHISVHETTRLNAEGQPVTERSINVRLVDPVSALRLDDQLERRRERTASNSSSDTSPDSNSPPPHPASPEYAHNLLRQKTKGLDEANHTLALLKKALAEADDRELQLSKELDEKDRQLSKTLSLSNGSQMLSKVEGDATQRDTGCQPVQKKLETSTSGQPVGTKSPSGSETLNSSNVPPSKALSEVEARALSNAEGHAPSTRRPSPKPKKFGGYQPFGSSPRPPP